MRRGTRRGISFLVSLLALGLSLVSNATPAAAAANTILVDDDGAQCKTSIHTIHEALAIAEALPSWSTPTQTTIVVCKGTYAEPPMWINGANNLRLLAKKGVTVTPNTPSFAGYLFGVVASTNVTMRGFTIDGQSDLGPSSQYVLHVAAIYYSSTSGTITNNRIVNWRMASESNVNIRAISVNELPGQIVRVTNNTVINFQSTAISVNGEQIHVTGNRLNGSTFLGNHPFAMYISRASGGRVTGNRITSDAYPSAGAGSRGLTIAHSSNLRVSGNIISHFDNGIMILTTCDSGGTDNNRVTSNRILDSFNGVVLDADEPACGSPVHADNNRIMSNRIVVSGPALGNYGVRISAGPAGSTAFNTIVRGNTIRHYSPGQEVFVDPLSGGDYTGGVFGPNHIIP